MTRKTSKLHVLVLVGLVLGLLVAVPAVQAAPNAPAAVTFTYTELLGRPTANSIAVKIVPASACTLRAQYSTTSGGTYSNTSNVSASAATPATVLISGLAANTKYYYRLQYSEDGGGTWTSRPEKSFWTQRAAGSTFTFDLTTDSHVGIQLGNASNWTSTMNGVAADNPDFLIDLGDTVAMDNGSTSVALGDTAAAEQKYKDTLQYFNLVSASSAIYIVPGNHEQQEAWHLQGTLANSLPVMSKNAEKKYFLNPVNDAFYSGDTGTHASLSGDQLKQDYFAWTWGDALFVVISPFWTTTTKPYTTSAGGGETDATGSGNRWDWTLGLTQYNWLQSTLAGSSAKYKFVFAHQIVGGNGMTSPVNQVNYGHGGVDSANFVEWGGNNIDGTTYTWGTNRPAASGWGTQPIRQMLEANHVTAFFHGHDHQMAHESLNGVVYQAVPSGSFTGSFGNYTTGGNSGNTIWADSTQGPGHLKVTVGPTQTTVDFIRYNASTPVSAATYTMAPNATTSYNLTTAVSPSGGGTINPAAGVHAYASGTVVSVTATPAAGYIFTSWSGGVCSGSGACSVTMDANKSVTANFTAISGSVASAATPSNATPSVGQQIVVTININMSGIVPSSVALGSFTGSLEWNPAVLTYSSNTGIGAGFTGNVNTAGAGTGSIAFNGANTTGATGNNTVLQITFNVVGAGTSALDLGYSAMAAASSFANLLPFLTVTEGQVVASPAQYTLTMAVSPAGGGTTSPTVGAHSYASGSVVNITATPATGYHFVNWTGTGVADPNSASTTVTVDASKTVTANYSQDEYTLTVTSAHGTVAKVPDQATYHEGDVVQLTATPAVGWSFVNWTGALSSSANPASVTIHGNTAVTANYSQDEYTLTVTSAHGTVAKVPDQATYHEGDVVQLTATPAVGWSFVNWTGALSSSTNPASVTIHGNTAVTANYSQDEYTLTVTSAHGTVAKVPDQATYHEGDVVQLTATPAVGWSFVNWTGDLTSSANPASVTIHGNTAVTANYSQDEYTLTVTSAHGTVAKVPDQATYHEGDVVQLTATPAVGWSFVNWTGALSSSANPASVTIHGNTAVTANYKRYYLFLPLISRN